MAASRSATLRASWTRDTAYLLVASTAVDALIIVDTLTIVNGRCAGGQAERSDRSDDGESECCPSVLAAPLDADEAADLARGFTALGRPGPAAGAVDAGRRPAGEVCVCDFVEPLGKSQPTISHHLKILGEAGLVHGDRRGKWVWYSLDRARLANLRAAIDA